MKPLSWLILALCFAAVASLQGCSSTLSRGMESYNSCSYRCQEKTPVATWQVSGEENLKISCTCEVQGNE